VPGSFMKPQQLRGAERVTGRSHALAPRSHQFGSLRDGGARWTNWCLVASGDLSFGLRERATASLASNSCPNRSQTETTPAPEISPGVALSDDSDRPGPEPAGAGARAPASAVRGELVSTRTLFQKTTYAGGRWPDFEPIWVNENMPTIFTVRRRR